MSEEFAPLTRLMHLNTQQCLTAHLHQEVVHAEVVLPATTAHAAAATKGTILVPATRPAEAGIAPKAAAATPAAATWGNGLLLAPTSLGLQTTCQRYQL